jgi:hypothetical protein
VRQDALRLAARLAIGRADTMKAAGTNRPVGSKYNAAMGQWVNEHGLPRDKNLSANGRSRCKS